MNRQIMIKRCLRDGDIPETVVYDYTLMVTLQNGAAMFVPRLKLYQEGDGFTSSINGSFRYLILSCTKKEAISRLKQMRKALLAYDTSMKEIEEMRLKNFLFSKN